jgi:hypothetical protein
MCRSLGGPSHHIFGIAYALGRTLDLVLRPVISLGSAISRLIGGLIAQVVLQVSLAFGLPLCSVSLGFLDQDLQPFVLFDLLVLFPQAHTPRAFPQLVHSGLSAADHHGTVGDQVHAGSRPHHTNRLQGRPTFRNTGRLGQVPRDGIGDLEGSLPQHEDHATSRQSQMPSSGV